MYAISPVILQPGGLLSWLIAGLIAGFLASAIVRGRSYGCLLNIVVGLIGSIIGGYVASLLGFAGVFHFWGSIIIAFLGAVILVAILQLFTPARDRRR